MLGTFVSALILGIFAGLAPGPYTTMVAATALEKGFKAGAKLATVPLFSDVPPLIVTALILERLNTGALSFIGIFGGVILAFIGFRFYRQHSSGDPHLLPDHAPQSASFSHVVLSTLLSPAPWLFWLVVAGPLMIRAWNRGWEEAVVYVVVLFGTNVGSAASLAWVASHSRKVLSAKWQRRTLSVVGGGLMFAGLFLSYQSLRGNFDDFIRQQETLREAVEAQADGLQEEADSASADAPGP